MTTRRLNQILETRNIRGLLLPPQEKSTALDLNWDRFSAVTFGYSLLRPELHMVANHEYRNMRRLMKELHCRGYKRPGLLGFKSSAARAQYTWLAAFMLEQLEVEESNRITPLIMEEWNDFSFLNWYETYEPDVIVTGLTRIVDCLDRYGIKAPENVGLGFHGIHDPDIKVSGIQKNAYQIGVMATDLVVDMLQRNETGVPRFPKRHLIEGVWSEGETLRPRSRGQAAVYFDGSRKMNLNFPQEKSEIVL